MVEYNKIKREREILKEELEILKINQRFVNDFFIEHFIGNKSYEDRMYRVLYEGNLN